MKSLVQYVALLIVTQQCICFEVHEKLAYLLPQHIISHHRLEVSATAKPLVSPGAEYTYSPIPTVQYFEDKTS